ncbi:MAG: hypothetical protein L0G94_13605 [Brachybacterium sp.]|uniref:hypothetical protein n=1 Tax=Brachybacterium sp. TaxID=1891286 RepID=UPI002647DBC4|nr:hypothetical protein [Brachybacterium sp.]MDN5687689.1 hypothetical protein [Brachybacterium sp.]
MADTSMVAQPTMYADLNAESARTQDDGVNDATAYQEFVEGVVVEMPTDANVREYAARWAGSFDQMKSLAEKGRCSTSGALSELDQVTPGSASRGSPVERFEAYQMRRWVERSNEDLADAWDQER